MEGATSRRGGTRPTEEPTTSEPHYQALLEAIPDLIFRLDAEGRFLGYAPAKDQPLLIPPSEFLGRTVSEVLPAELAPRVMQRIEQALQTGETQALQYRIPVPLPDGNPRDYEARIAASGNDEVVAIVRDITRSRRAREALRESEERLRSLVANAPVVMFAIDSEGVFTAAEGKAMSLVGLKSDEHIGRSVFDVYRDVPEVVDAARRALAGEAFTTLVELQERTFEANVAPVRDEGGKVKGAVAVATDITKRARAEKALRESEERFRRLAEDSIDGILLVEADEVQFVNAALVKMLGYEREEEIVGRPFTDFVSPGQRDMMLARAQARREGREVPSMYELRVLRKDGSEFDAEISVSTIFHQGRQARQGVIRDVTERKRAEEALRDSERRYRLLADNVTDTIWTADLDWNLTYVSPSVERLWGYTVEECLAMGLRDFLTPAAAELAWKDYAESLAAARKSPVAGSRTQEFEIRRPDGSTGWVEIAMRFLRDPHGQPAGVLGVSRDVTARKEAEEALRESEERFRRLAEDSIDGIALAEGLEIRFVNKALVEMLGYDSDQEIVGRPFTDLVAPEYREMMAERGRARREGLEVPSRYEFRALRKDGIEFDAEVSISAIAYRGGRAQQGVVRDITERRQAEEALRERERVLTEVQAITHVGSWDINLLTREETLSDEMYAILGIDKSADTHVESVMRLVHPDDAKAAHQAFEDGVNGNPCRLEYRIVQPDGEIRSVLTEGARLVRDGTGRPVRLVGATQDITERKEAEDALRQSEAKFRKLAESAAAAVFIYRGTRPLFVNTAMEELTGYTQEEILARELWQFVHPDFQGLVKERSRARQQGSEAPSRYVFSVVRKNGEERWVDFTATMIEFEGEPAALGTAYDITERKRAENVLRESEGRYRLLAENVTDTIWTADLKLNLTFVSPSISRLTGYTVEEAMALSLEDVLTPQSLDIIQTVYAEELAGPALDQKDPGRSRTLELEVYRKDGSTIWIEANMAFLRNAAGRPVGVLGVARNVTERRRAEEAAKESEAKWRSLVENAPALIMTLDRDGTIQFANRGVTGAPLEEAIGSSIFRYAPPQYHEDMREVFALVFKTGESGGDFDVPWPESDGSTSWHTARVGPLKQDGEVVALTIIATDVTERRRADDALRESEERFRTLAEAALEGMVIHDGTRVLEANQEMAIMLGCRLSDIIGTEFSRFVTPESYDLMRQHILSGSEEPYEAVALRIDGTPFPVELRAKKSFYQGREVRLGAARDITERKRAEEALQREREALETKAELGMDRARRYKLTFRELTVLYLVAAGMADKEIAFRLGISHRTASKHVENILSKLGAMSRTEAGVRAVQEGLVENLK
jgi:PAS domain S-box-containing protein